MALNHSKPLLVGKLDRHLPVENVEIPVHNGVKSDDQRNFGARRTLHRPGQNDPLKVHNKRFKTLDLLLS